MKPSPSYTGPILTSLATLFAAGGACLYAVNVQKIFGGMRAERESSFELILCGFLPLLSRHDPVFRFRLLLILSLFNLPRLSPSNAFFTT